LFGGVQGSSARRTWDVNELIMLYEEALKSGNRQNVNEFLELIRSDPTALNHIKANRPDLYENVSLQSSQSVGSVLVSSDATIPRFPTENQPFPSTQMITSASSNSENFQPHPSGDQSAADLKSLNQQLLNRLPEGTILMSVGGVSEDARRNLKRILIDEKELVESVREVRYKNGQVIYRIEMNIQDSRKFAQTFDNRQFGSFTLDLIGLQGRQMEFILKRN
jgi:hypothetical protein